MERNHPYGENESEETVEKITVEKAKTYYANYLKPNISYLIILGDITKEEAQPLVEKYFGRWLKGPIDKKEFPTPQKPVNTKVSFVSKSGATQSVITITYPVDIKPGAEDWIPARVMNAILGGPGLSSRINQNLREDKGFTYGGRF